MILQFSKLPPPIGGVTIHVSRLIFKSLSLKNMKIESLDYSNEKNIFKWTQKILSSKIIHIHLSNKRLRLLFTLLFKILFKKVIITFHGKYDFENINDRWALKLSSASILLNDYSFSFAKSNKQKGVYKIGAFIPPVEEKLKPLKKNFVKNINELKKKYHKVFCTNASSLAYDKKGNEIYMGKEIVKYFQDSKDIALVFSSPNDEYYKFLKIVFPIISDNVYFIKEKHDFANIIKITDGLIRATTMDGDSISVKEALYYKKPVFATNVVDRPKGVVTFSDFSDFDVNIKNLETKIHVEDNSDNIFKLYNTFL